MRSAVLSILLLATASALAAEPATLTVQLDKPGARLNPNMWGIFFEDINFGADGGLYAELVKNRSFEFPVPLMGWNAIPADATAGSAEVRAQEPAFTANPHYLRVRAGGTANGFRLANEGFRGIGVHGKAAYAFSAHVRSVDGGPLTIRVELVSDKGRVLASSPLKDFGPRWAKHSATLRPAATDAKARLCLVVEGRGTLDLDHVSLFPEATWKFRPGGLRADLVQILADLRPGFMRFPGGCVVEGHHLPQRYQWKKTLGPVEQRPLLINRWNDEFKHRPAPDYFQSFGLGFYEYFLLCEEIGAQPLPILNCGMACQFNSGELVPLDQLEPFIQDALDLIEFANGPASSPWGGKRAAMGHPQPFRLSMLGIGNEQWGPQYIERYERFAKALKARHPEIQLVSSAGPDPDGEKFDFLWPKLRALQADLIDEHYYRPPAWFLDNTARYDRYDRRGPKVFAGEYAAQSVKTVSPDNRNNWQCALAEAAFLTGLERNGDVVRIASYAPLMAHVDAWQWRPNLIWCDNLRVYGTPNYYVQQAFSCNRGDGTLPLTLDRVPKARNGQPRLFASATLDERAGEVVLKVVNATAAAQPVALRLQAAAGAKPADQGTAITLAAELADENSLEQPRKVAPTVSSFDSHGGRFTYPFRPHSLTVLRLAAR